MTGLIKRSQLAAIFTLVVMLASLLMSCGDSTATTKPTNSIDTSNSSSNLATTAATLPTSAAGAAGGKLEIFSWWTSGGEADGLKALYDVYKKQNPTVEFINASVAGGAGTNAKTVLVTRMQGGQPPDSFQVHAGQELIGTWVVANKMEPITQLFVDQGWNKVIPKLLLDQITHNGEIYSVPVNIHRSNVLWYNKKVFDQNGLTAPKTIEEFFEVAVALKAKGITPLAIGGKDKFEAPHLFESVLLATFGPDDYAKLFKDGNAWNDPRMATAIATMGKMLNYANGDRASLSWADAAQKMLDGSAGMTIMGDWAEGYFLSKNARPGVDFGWSASPGTDGTFLWLSDSFGLPKNAPHKDAALAWLKVLGSKEGQDAFNPKKGSIPARTDTDKSLYDDYLKWSIGQFSSSKLTPSVVHGAAANEAFTQAYDNSLNVFSADKDVKALTQALSEATKELK